MKVLLSWLREFAPFDGDPEQLGELLSDLGLAVEEMQTVGEGLDGVVVARVLDVRAIDGADKIRLVDVDPGDGEARQIVLRRRPTSPWATRPAGHLGAVMPGGFEIARRKMRGEESNGMLCSARELGFGDDHAGILQLDGALQPGTPLREALGIEPDVLYDLEVNPNRPDAMSVAGVARDLAARMGLPFTLPSPQVTRTGEPADAVATIELVDPDLCGRFQARVLRNVTVGQSPQWLANRLTQLGMRPINALVDISNYVMLELGQPNHPYDLALVPGGGFRVRRGRDGEALTTLDDVERRVSVDDLLICGADDTPIGIAGVMGGASCEISASTTDVLLEMAWFRPMAISRTSRRLGLRTEASARFDKGCDPEVIDLAADRFCQLAAEICGATTAPGAVDVRGELPDRSPVRVRTARVNAILGTDLDGPTIAGHLESIGFATTAVGADHDVVVPSWRYDSSAEIDVIEEVARLHGYSRIAPEPLPSSRTGRLTERQLERRRAAAGHGRHGTGRGHAAAVPRARRAHPLWAARRGHLPRQPAGRRRVGAAHLAAPRAGAGGGPQRHPPPARHRPLRDRPRVPPPAGRPAAARRARVPRRDPRRPRRRGSRGRMAGGGRHPRRCRRQPWSTPRSPGCTPPARATSWWPARSSVSWARSTPRCSPATTSASAWPGCRSTSPGCWPCRTVSAPTGW